MWAIRRGRVVIPYGARFLVSLLFRRTFSTRRLALTGIGPPWMSVRRRRNAQKFLMRAGGTVTAG
jgi:hypothetical protein